MFQNIGEMIVLFWRSLGALPSCWRNRQKIFDQLFEIGNASLLMACILSLFIGGVLALQAGSVLVQRGLGSLGFLHGPADGVAGEATAKAIRNFEVYFNYKVTGRISPELLDLLLDNGAAI